MGDTGTFGSGLTLSGNDGNTPQGFSNDIADVPASSEASQPGSGSTFGAGLRSLIPGPNYRAPDPAASALDQTADTLQQRIERANNIATNPILQFFNPEGAVAARNFVPQATEMLQKIKQQKAGMQAARTQADTLGLAPGEVPDEASMADRVAVAQSKALKGDLRVWKGLQAVDPKAAEAIQDQVHEAAAGHLTKAQLAFDSLAGMQNQGQYQTKLAQLRRDGTLTDLEALGLKVPPSFEAFSATKAREGQALRDARIGIDTIRQKLEDRNTYQPMEKKEAETYHGRLTTVYGDQITNGTWARNGAMGTRGLVVNGAADPRDLGKSFTLATPEQRKAIREDFDAAIPKAEMHKYREFERTYQLATTDGKGKPVPEGKINTNPNVQQGIAEGLASMLRGGSGGANVGLLKIETNKRGFVQGFLDTIVGNYAGALNALSEKDVKPYLTKLTQSQIRDVMDTIKGYNDNLVEDRVAPIGRRAGALGLNSSAFGFGKNESAGAIADAIKAGRDEQIARMMPNHQAIGGGDGVIQLGAQRPGVGATNAPPGTAAATQLPGAPPLTTPVQQATQTAGAVSSQGSAPTPPAVSLNQSAPVLAPQPGGSGPAGGGPAAPGTPPAAPAPVTIAGQPVSVALPPGASASYAQATQRIESGREKDPWKATIKATSASGAFQFTNGTWAENKPAGAPDRAADATPAQQSEAFAKFTAKNAQTLTANGVPVNDTSLYVAHNLGATGGSKLLTADAGADARTVVGDVAARNNPLFFKGRPTVATVLERYRAEMEKGALPPTSDEPKKPLPGSGGGTGLLDRVRSYLNAAAAPEGSPNPSDASLSPGERAAATHAAAGMAPAALSTAGALGGSVAGPAGTVAGGALGGGAGQSLKDFLQGRDQSPAAIAKETALGAVLGIMPAGRPLVGAAARAGGAGSVQAGAAAAEGASGPDIVDAGVSGAGAAAGGELFGRALGMVGHKVFSMFTPDAQKAVQGAAKKFSEAETTLTKEAPTIPGAGGAAATKNPKYLQAEADRMEAERVLKDAGLKPEEAAYAYKVSSEGVPKQEAEVTRPAAIEKDRIGAGYQQLEQEVGVAGQGAPKASPKLPDGPLAAVEAGKVSKDHAELAGEVEMAITAPAKNWREKWVQLKDERSKLLTLEREAESSTVPGRSRIANNMRALADTVRTQQAKAAKYVFGEKDGEAFMSRLKVLDTRYRNLMEATNNGDLAKAAVLKGEAGREAERKFVAFAHDDPQAISAYRAMRGARGDLAEATVPWTVAAEGLPVVGKVVKVAKLAGIMREWARERAAGSPVKFSDMVKLSDDTGQRVRDVVGTAVQRGAVMQ